MKTARKTMEVVNPIPAGTLQELTRQTVDGFVAAQKALLDIMPKTGRAPGLVQPMRMPKPLRIKPLHGNAPRALVVSRWRKRP